VIDGGHLKLSFITLIFAHTLECHMWSVAPTSTCAKDRAATFIAIAASGASSLEKRVCRGRAAFDITSQHKTTLSLQTRNQLINFAMLPKYYISKILSIYRISAIFAHKRSCRKPKLLLHLWLINTNSLYFSLRCAALRLHQAMRNLQTTLQSSQ